MVCGKCGEVSIEGTKFCTKCGYKFSSQNEKLNGLAIASIVSIAIGIILYLCIRYSIKSEFEKGLVTRANYYGRIIGRLSWGTIRDLFLHGGIILAFVSLYMQRNKIILIAGIICTAFNLVYPLLILMGIPI